MCGIVGYIGPNPEQKKELIGKMQQSISHRGPDHATFQIYNQACIGFNRLSINDLSEKGNQPFHLDKVTVFCNGEIYNHKELRKQFNLTDICKSGSDIEIIPHLYRIKGWDFLNLVNGMFALVLLDGNEIFLVTDRFGKKPLYIIKRSGGFYFASELKAFLLNFDCEIDKSNLSIGFFLGYFPYPITPVKEIEKIPPASIIRFSGKNPDRKIWYILQPDYDVNYRSLKENEENYQQLLDDAVKIRMEADVEAGCYLSGGLDSTSIAASYAKQSSAEFHAFCGIISGKEYSTDNKNASRYSKEIGAILHKIPINNKTYDQKIVKTCWAFDEIPFESANLNFIEVADNAKEYVKIMLDGIGGDEIFLGYPAHLILHKVPQAFREIIPYNFNVLKQSLKLNRRFFYILHALMDTKKWFVYARAFIPLIQMLTSKHFNAEKLNSILDKYNDEYTKGFRKHDINCCSYIDILGYNMLNYQHSDRCSMAFSIEPRSPLSDYRIWEGFCGLEETVKLKHGLKTYMKEISPKLPKYIKEADKDGFSSPIYLWFQQDENLLNNAMLLVRRNYDLLCELLDETIVEPIIKKWNNNSSQLWMDGIHLHMLVSLVLWYKIYFQNFPVSQVNCSLSEIINSYK